MPIYRVRYSSINRDRGPYVMVRFYYNKDENFQEEFAILDSASNNIIIPFSLGRIMNFSHPKSKSDFKTVAGVEGKELPCVEQTCRIFLVHKKQRKIYRFYETVLWLHPYFEDFKRIKWLENENKKTRIIREKEKQEKEIKEITGSFDRSGIILGRSFFNNFEYIKFEQKKNDGYFYYKIKKPENFKEI